MSLHDDVIVKKLKRCVCTYDIGTHAKWLMYRFKRRKKEERRRHYQRNPRRWQQQTVQHENYIDLIEPSVCHYSCCCTNRWQSNKMIQIENYYYCYCVHVVTRHHQTLL